MKTPVSDREFPTRLPMSELCGYDTITKIQRLRLKTLNSNSSRHVDFTNSEVMACVVTVSVLRQCWGRTGGTKDSLLPEANA